MRWWCMRWWCMRWWCMRWCCMQWQWRQMHAVVLHLQCRRSSSCRLHIPSQSPYGKHDNPEQNCSSSFRSRENCELPIACARTTREPTVSAEMLKKEIGSLCQ